MKTHPTIGRNNFSAAYWTRFIFHVFLSVLYSKSYQLKYTPENVIAPSLPLVFSFRDETFSGRYFNDFLRFLQAQNCG